MTRAMTRAKQGTLETAERMKTAQIRRQIVDIEVDIADMRATFVRIGERSDWQDTRLCALDEDIAFWEERVEEMRRHLDRLERAAARRSSTSDLSDLEARSGKPSPAA